jgi:hypothetical protein
MVQAKADQRVSYEAVAFDGVMADLADTETAVINPG